MAMQDRTIYFPPDLFSTFYKHFSCYYELLKKESINPIEIANLKQYIDNIVVSLDHIIKQIGRNELCHPIVILKYLFWKELEYIENNNHLEVLQKENKRLKDKNRDLEKKKEEWKKSSNDPQISRLSGQIETLEKKLQTIDEQLREKEDIIASLKNQLEKKYAEKDNVLALKDTVITQKNQDLKEKDGRIASLVRQLEEKIEEIARQKKIIEERDRELAALRVSPEAAPKPKAVAQPEKPDPDIFLFHLPDAQPPFSGSLKNMLARLDEAERDTAKLLTYLEKSGYRSAPAYVTNIKKFADALAKLREKAAQKTEDDPEELSEWLTEKYLTTFARTLFTTVLPGISRGLPENRNFYLPFLRLVNEFLSQSGFYTRKVAPGELIRNEDYVDMELITQTVSDPEKNKHIEFVERLPYYLKYYDSSGELAALHYPGRMVVLQLKRN